MEGIERASKVLPAPGGPIIKGLSCPEAYEVLSQLNDQAHLPL